MFVRVDLENKREPTEGFAYSNQDGHMEYVHVDTSPAASIEDAAGNTVTIYEEDIPLLIKALQAAYDHIQKGK